MDLPKAINEHIGGAHWGRIAGYALVGFMGFAAGQYNVTNEVLENSKAIVARADSISTAENKGFADMANGFNAQSAQLRQTITNQDKIIETNDEALMILCHQPFSDVAFGVAECSRIFKLDKAERPVQARVIKPVKIPKL